MVKLKSEKINGVTVQFNKLSSGMVAFTAGGKGGLSRKAPTKKKAISFAKKRFSLFDKLLKSNPKLTQGDFLREARKKNLD